MLPVGIENFEEIRCENFYHDLLIEILAYGTAFCKKRCLAVVEKL